ncbi:MAG: hypothetical protein AAFV53_09345 [Myxococcota bacterium]
MIVLCVPEGTLRSIRRDDLRLDIQATLRKLGIEGRLLRVICGEQDRAILPPTASGEVAVEVVVQQIFIRDLFWIEDDADGFGVAADVMVGGLRLWRAGVADAGLEDTMETPEPGIGSPESTHGEGRVL